MTEGVTMIYYETRVLDDQGREVASYLHDARSETEALALARTTFYQYHPNKDHNKHQFEARLHAEGASVTGYGR